ncbi:MAG: cation:proton antiporter [Pseudomonadota bacterium]
MSFFDVAAAIVVCAAAFGYLNHRLIGLRQTTGLTIMGALGSLAVVALDRALPGVQIGHELADLIEAIDFRQALMEGMLSFLLFAGALHVDLQAMKRSALPIAAITCSGVLLSTALIGGLAWGAASLAGIALAPAWCLLFGALISPTDPVAVLGILKSARIPPSLEAMVAGESLFNDGLAIVAFTVLLEIALGAEQVSLAEAASLFAGEALGGAALGLAAGWLSFFAMRSINEHNLEVLITLALVMGGYALAHRLHVNGPIAMAVAGLIIGNHGRRLAMDDVTRDYVTKFWSLIDETLNAILFLLIGVEVIVILDDWRLILFGVAAIPLTLFARAVSVGVPMLALWQTSGVPRGSYPILVLGGVRGGISIALALSLPEGPYKHLIVMATYVVVAFSVVLQASTVGMAARRIFSAEAGRTDVRAGHG